MKWKPCLHMEVLSWRLRPHQLWLEGLSVMLEYAESVQRGTSGSPSLAAVASATKPWIRFLFPKKAKRLRVIDDDNLKHLFKYLFGLPPARQQAKRLQLITHTLGFWASKYICVSLGFVSLYPTYVHIIYSESPHTKKPLHGCNGFYNFDKFPNYNGTYYPLKFKN